MVTKTINGSTSKGNQPKFVKGGFLYKEDSMGYESISEALVSEFLSFVDNVDFIDYYLDIVNRHGKNVCCCKSKIYTGEDESFVSVYKLLNNANKLNPKIFKKINGRDLVDYVVDNIKILTGVDIRGYLALLSVVDAITLNEDRHFNNICLIERGGEYRVAPIYDNGLSLLSDTSDYPMGERVSVLINRVKCRPFNVSFSKQVRYFDFNPLNIRYDDLVDKLNLVEVPFKEKEFLRAKMVLLKRLRDTEGYLWKRL